MIDKYLSKFIHQDIYILTDNDMMILTKIIDEEKQTYKDQLVREIEKMWRTFDEYGNIECIDSPDHRKWLDYETVIYLIREEKK